MPLRHNSDGSIDIYPSSLFRWGKRAAIELLGLRNGGSTTREQDAAAPPEARWDVATRGGGGHPLAASPAGGRVPGGPPARCHLARRGHRCCREWRARG